MRQKSRPVAPKAEDVQDGCRSAALSYPHNSHICNIFNDMMNMPTTNVHCVGICLRRCASIKVLNLAAICRTLSKSEGVAMSAVAAKTRPSQDTRRNARLEARVPEETKVLWERAAAIQGRKMTEFVVTSAVEAAHRVIRDSELADLTRRDKIAFVEALLNPPPPNARLRNAAARHSQMFGR
jgi:uncharacterized protein (DUF1778 family)